MIVNSNDYIRIIMYDYKRTFHYMFKAIFNFIFVMNILVNYTNAMDKLELDKSVNIFNRTAVEGRSVSFPCPLTDKSRDRVFMVLFFKNDAGIPFYTFDARGKALQQGKHWSAPEVFGSRAKFNINVHPSTLEIEDIKRMDEGIYRCRIDFRTAQTQSFRYNLSVIILPEHPAVFNRWGRQLNGSLLGPKEEGDDIVLTCRVVGGIPKPTIRWLKDGIKVDDQIENSSGDIIENRLLWPSVTRADLNSIFTCQAMNTMLVEPKETSFVLDMHLKPLTVEILNPPNSLVADRRYEVTCESSGSRPNAIITWYKGKRQLKRSREETFVNKTRSILNFVPTTEDDKKIITCRAENPKVSGLFLETTWKIDVVYPPIVTLALGPSLSADDIKENDDVYFECSVISNPPWRKLTWLHNNIVIPHNASARIIRSNQSLVLQKIRRNSTGNYSCSAVNNEGETVSNQISLRVKYAPFCVSNKVMMVGAFRSEILNIVCEVQSYPPPRSFKWKFNSSGEAYNIERDHYFKNGSSRSILRYTPVSDTDFGTLLCAAGNEVGEQTQPCTYQIVLATLPSNVRNCTLYNNQTQYFLEVQCLPGFDGGIFQWFILELVSVKTGIVRLNLTNLEEPYFTIDSIEKYTTFINSQSDDNILRIVVYAVNQKGKSVGGVLIREFLLETTAENRPVIKSGSFDVSPILLGVLFTLALLCLVIFIKIYSNKRMTSNNEIYSDTKQINSINYKQDSQKKNSPRWRTEPQKITSEFTEDAEEKDPDIIPQYVTNSVNSEKYIDWPSNSNSNLNRFNQDKRENILMTSNSSTSFTVTNIPHSDGGQGEFDVNVIKTLLLTKVPESCV